MVLTIVYFCNCIRFLAEDGFTLTLENYNAGQNPHTIKLSNQQQFEKAKFNKTNYNIYVK